MKKIVLSLAFVFFLSLVCASVTQNNVIDYGIIENDGSLNITSTLTNTNVIAYNCSTADCSAGGPVLFGPINIPGNSIVITYPTSLAGLAGYGLYFYKDGYVPFEAFANWYGTGTPSDFRPYLTKQRTCAIPLSSLGVSYAGGNIVVNANVGSPIQNAGPLNYVPASLASQYSVNVQVNLTISGTSAYSEVKTVNIPFSNTAGVSFTNAFGDGTYNISVGANTNDKCINSATTNLILNNYVVNTSTPDVVAPGSVSGINVINTTNTSISFGWTNPTDSDFNGTIVYLNGIYNRTLNSNTNQTTFNGLTPNTNYTITINTIDLTGNVNGTNMSLSVLTNATVVPPVDSIPPLVSIISPTNVSYNVSNIIFNVSLNELGIVAFSLDNGITNYSMTSTDNLHFNYSANGLADGSYRFRVYASDFAGNNNNSESRVFLVNTSTPDTTAPGSVLNLINISSTNTSITWNWTNPNDFDFNGTLVYIDNVFVVKLSPNTHNYTGTGFSANSSHSITINTIDLTGNVNGTNVTNSARTSITSGGNNGDDDNEHDNKPRNYTVVNYGQDRTSNKIIYGTSDDSGTIFINSKETTEEFNLWYWIIFFLVLEIIIVLALIFIASKKKKKRN
jgi:hypothetical protein